MARKSEEILQLAGQCLASPSPERVEAVRKLDSDIDELEVKVDRMCVELLALQEPYAIDFRFVFSAIKMIKDFERVGDECKTVAKWSVRLPAASEPRLQTLAERSSAALRTAVKALVEDNREAAEVVMQIEFTVDALEDEIVESTDSIATAFIAKALERTGVLATNVAEDVIFTLSAKDIRHGHFDDQ